MPNHSDVLTALKRELKQAEMAVGSLAQAIRALEKLGKNGSRPSRVISAAGRKRIAEAQRKRWAKLRLVKKH